MRDKTHRARTVQAAQWIKELANTPADLSLIPRIQTVKGMRTDSKDCALTYAFIPTHAHIHIHTHAHTHTHMCMHTCTHTYTHILTCTPMNTYKQHVHTHMHIYTHAYAYTHTHTCMYAYMHAHTHCEYPS